MATRKLLFMLLIVVTCVACCEGDTETETQQKTAETQQQTAETQQQTAETQEQTAETQEQTAETPEKSDKKKKKQEMQELKIAKIGFLEKEISSMKEQLEKLEKTSEGQQEQGAKNEQAGPGCQAKKAIYVLHLRKYLMKEITFDPPFNKPPAVVCSIGSNKPSGQDTVNVKGITNGSANVEFYTTGDTNSPRRVVVQCMACP